MARLLQLASQITETKSGRDAASLAFFVVLIGSTFVL
jgi:hypothetical protein